MTAWVHAARRLVTIWNYATFFFLFWFLHQPMNLLPYSLFVRQQFPFHPKHPGNSAQTKCHNFWCLLFMPSWVCYCCWIIFSISPTGNYYLIIIIIHLYNLMGLIYVAEERKLLACCRYLLEVKISNLDRIQLSSASLLSLIAPPTPHETKLRNSSHWCTGN